MTRARAPRAARISFAAIGAALALLVACTGGGSPAVTPPSTENSTPDPEPTVLSTTSAPDAEVMTLPRPAEGSPFGGADLIQALAAAGLNSGPQDHGVGCNGAGSHGRAWATAGDGGDTSSPGFTLWVYPSSEALQDDWELPPTGPPITTLDHCPLGSGFVYWNENLLLVFDEPRNWEDREALRERITAAFLALEPSN